MKINSIIDDRSFCHQEVVRILNKLHQDGPVEMEDLESLSYIKYFQPKIFDIYEAKVITLLGLFYKLTEPKSFLEEVYGIFADSIKETTGKSFTPVQADAYRHILDKTFFSFSAPTSTGKSFVFQELIRDCKGDMVIVVPSRALISEYINVINKLVDKSVLILQFVDIVNTKNTKRRIFVITPERGVELFKNIDRLNIQIILFDEAQISEEGIRGMRFDSLVRRTHKVIPTAKKVFTHPFIRNPEAQLLKHNFRDDSGSKLYPQHSVGKIFLVHRKSGRKSIFKYFSPFEKGKNKTKIPSKSDIAKQKIIEKGTVLVYVSKKNILDGSFVSDFKKYIRLCPALSESEAVEYVGRLKEFIGASDNEREYKHSLMIDLMKKGIVMHHGSMPLKARLLIEEFVNKGFARICFSTSTLAQGINMPFDVVWVKNFKFSGSEDQKNLNLKNLIGRAGRSTLKKDFFDYGFVIIEQQNVPTFCERIIKHTAISETSSIDREISSIDEDEKDLVEAIRGDTFNDQLQLTNTQVERIANSQIDDDILLILDNLIKDNQAIKTQDYYLINTTLRKEIKLAFANIFTAHLRRKELTPAEKDVLGASIPILLWQLQGKSFSEIISLRYSFLSKRDDRRAIVSKLRSGEIDLKEARSQLRGLFVKYTPPANPIPDRTLRRFPLFKRKQLAASIPYDAIVYDTYDYIDKVLSLSLKDPLSAAFEVYFTKTKDMRAKVMSNYIKYGTNDEVEILLTRYGFSFDDIGWIKEYLDSISEEGIVFKDSIKNLPADKFKIIDRFVS